MAHHKRKRTKNQRAGCYCLGKENKHNGWLRTSKLKGVNVPRRIRGGAKVCCDAGKDGE